METTNEATVYAREARLVYEKREPGARALGSKIESSGDAALHVARAIGSPMVEHFVCIALNARLRVVGWTTIGVGTVSACPVDVAQVARFAVLSGAASIVLGHNHPSGDPSPSPEDLTLTERIAAALKILGVSVLDHVIVADGERAFFSLLDAGILRAGAR